MELLDRALRNIRGWYYTWSLYLLRRQIKKARDRLWHNAGGGRDSI